MIKWLANLIIKKYKLVLALSAALLVTSILTAKNIGMDSKMDSMLPKDSESIKAGEEYGKYFDSQDTVLVVVKGEGKEVEKYLASLSRRLYEDKIANNVLYKLEISTLEDYLHLYLDTKNYKDLENDLDNPNSPLSSFLKNKDLVSFTSLFIEALNNTPKENKQKLFSTFTKLLMDENQLSNEEMEYLIASLVFGEMNNQSEQAEYLVSDSKDTYLMIVKPNIDMENLVTEREGFFKSLDAAIKQAKKESSYMVEVGITGGALVQDYEADTTIFNNFYSTAIATFIIIILFIVLSFRRAILPLASGYPLILGALLSTAAAYFLYKNLNMFSISFAVLLLGLGIDFAVHIITRYLEERAAGFDLKTSISNALNETGIGIIIGAVTTSIAFFAFLAADFKAFTQMGVISGAGIMILCITMLFVMPSIIMLLDSKRQLSKKVTDSEYKFLKPVGRLIERRPWIFVTLALVLVLGVTSNVVDSNIQTDMSKIYPEDMESLKWLDVVEDNFDYNPTTLQFMVNNVDELQRCVNELTKRSDVKKIESILKYMPEEQDYKIGVIKKFNNAVMQPVSPSPQSNAKIIIESLTNLRESVDSNNIDTASEGYKTLEFIADGLESQNPQNILRSLGQSDLSLDELDLSKIIMKEEKLTIDKLPDNLKANFIGKEGKLSVEVSPSVNIWQDENFTGLKNAIKAVSGHYPVGMPAIMNEVTVYVKNDALKISFFCIAILFILLLVMFRKLKDSIITLLPLLISIYVTLGIMPVIGADLNIFSIVSFPVLIGIGIDSSVHLAHRIKSSPDKDIDYILSHTGKAIVMTILTTLIGFGSLYFTNHPGLASFGLTTAAGMFTCLLITLTVLPSLYTILYKSGSSHS